MDEFLQIANDDNFYKMKKLKVMYRFFDNGNYMYCQKFDTKEIVSERKIKDYELPKKNKNKRS